MAQILFGIGAHGWKQSHNLLPQPLPLLLIRPQHQTLDDSVSVGLIKIFQGDDITVKISFDNSIVRLIRRDLGMGTINLPQTLLVRGFFLSLRARACASSKNS